MEPGRLLLLSDVEWMFLTVHPEQQILGFERVSALYESVRLSVCLPVFEDVRQNPFTIQNVPDSRKTGLISKSLVNKRKTHSG